MRVAIVSQPIDRIRPPGQNSIGGCTHGLASYLAKSCEVIAYGLAEKNRSAKPIAGDANPSYVFFRSTLSDRLKHKIRLIPMSSPISTSGWWFPDWGREVAEDIRKRNCDLIHIQQCSQYVPAIRALNPSARIVLHLHNRWFSQSNRPVLERRIRKVDLITAVSDFVRDHIRREFPIVADRCETMYNGVDPREFIREKEYDAARERTEKQILFVGAVSPHSGVHVLLDAFKRVVQKYPHVHLKIIGPQSTYPFKETFDIKDRAALESLAPFYRKKRIAGRRAGLFLSPVDGDTYMSHLRAKLSPDISGKVTFLGALDVRSELLEHYYAADIFAFPPVCEHGFGLSPVEAMAAGTPCVASRSGGIVETVKDSETGFLVGKNDPEALAQAIVSLLENDRLREAFGRAARRRTLERFTWDRVARRTYDCYRSLCEGSPCQPDAWPGLAPSDNWVPEDDSAVSFSGSSHKKLMTAP